MTAPPQTEILAGEPVPESPVAHRWQASPNHGERQKGLRPDCIVLHYTGMASGRQALDWLCNPASNVSCHYFVEEDGAVLQLVAEARRAWHAGKSYWAGETDINSCSLGIEIVNAGHPGGLPPFPPAQIEAVIALCHDLARRHAIAPARVLAHSDIAPRRKIDPGEAFPWEELHRAGIGLWAAPAPIIEGPLLRIAHEGDAVAALQEALGGYGYFVERTGIYDERTELAVEAFQRRYRPALVDGVADVSTIATLRELMRVWRR